MILIYAAETFVVNACQSFNDRVIVSIDIKGIIRSHN